VIRSSLFTAALASLLLWSGCAPAEDEVEPEVIAVTATPVPEEVTEEPLPEPTPEPSPEEVAEPTPTAPEERDPTDSDRARFIASYDPGGVSGGRQVAADIDGDGIAEIVFAFVVEAEQRSRVDVAAWSGTSYDIVTRELGGPAERLEELRISDINGDGRIEVVVIQRVGDSRSATLWVGGAGGALDPLRGVGDCFDGSHTYGDTDVTVADRTGDGRAEVRAVCEDPDRPRPLWPEVVYQWEDDAYRCSYRMEADGSRTDCA
jgi:hypothetical protein